MNKSGKVFRYCRRYAFTLQLIRDVGKNYNLSPFSRTHFNLLVFLDFAGGVVSLGDIRAATRQASKYNLLMLRYLKNHGLINAIPKPGTTWQRDSYEINETGLKFLAEVEAAIKKHRPPVRWINVQKKVKLRAAKLA